MNKEILKQLILSNSGVPYVKGMPGTGKTQILEQIAGELNLKYIDVRLSQVDEVEVAGLPVVEDNKESFKYATPPWVEAALHHDGFDGTLIVFEELNRAELAQRNAAMQILNERRVGLKKLPTTIYMAATGNLGEEDGTEVNELDQAMNNRLLHIKHELDVPTWRKAFADKNVHWTITSFVQEHPSFFLRLETDKPAFATPRSWTFLSDFVIKTFGKESSPGDIMGTMSEVAHLFVGEAAGRKYVNFLEDQNAITINDVLKRYEKVEEKLKNFNRPKMSSLIYELQRMDFNTLKEKELVNVGKFLHLVPDDEKVSILQDLVIKFETFTDNKMAIKKMLVEFKDLLLHIKDHKESKEE